MTPNVQTLAASSRPRRGTTVRLVRIIPVAYSEVTTSTPSAPTLIWANRNPPYMLM